MWLYFNVISETHLISLKALISISLISVINFYFFNFSRSLEMPLINCKFELKHRQSIVFVYENDKGNADSNIFTIKDTKLNLPVFILVYN